MRVDSQPLTDERELIDALRSRIATLERQLLSSPGSGDQPLNYQRLHEVMLEQLPAVMWTTDIDLRFTWGGGSGLRGLNLVPNELVGVSLQQYFKSDDSQFPPIAAHLEALRGQTASFALDWGGNSYEAHVRALLDAEGQVAGCIGLAIDVSSRKRAEALHARDALLLASVRDAIVATNAEGVISEWNEGATRLFEKGAAEMLGRRLIECFPESTWAEVSHVADAIRGGAEFTGELEFTGGHGTPLWIDARVRAVTDPQGDFAGMVGLAHDISARHQYEEDLRLRNTAIESATDGILITTAGTPEHSGQIENAIVYASPGFLRLTGYDATEVLDRNCRFLQGPLTDRAVVEQIRAALLEGRPFQGTILNYRKDGSQFWNDLRILPLHDSSGLVTQFVGTQTDATARVHAEQSLKLSRERYRQLFQSIPESAFVYDLETLRFLAVNDAMVVNYGFSREELLQMTIFDIRPPEDAQRLLKELPEIGPDYERRGDWRHQAKDGTLIDVEVFTHEIQFDGRNARLVLATDITIRKQQELRLIRYNEELAQRVDESTAELRASNQRLEEQVRERERTARGLQDSEARYRLLAEHATDLISRHSLDGVCLYASPAALTLLGYEPQQLLGVSVYELLHPEDVGRVREGLEQLESATTPVTVAFRLRRLDGEFVWFESSARTIRDVQTGSPQELVVVSRDISDRKQAERVADELRANLAQFSRASTMGQLSSGLAHELRQPLIAITAFAEGALQRVRSGNANAEGMERAIQQIIVAAERADQIIRRIQEFVRKGTISNVTCVPPAVLVGEVLELLESRLLRNRIEIRNELAADLPGIVGDSIQIQQVIVNVVSNAIEAMSENKDVPRRLTIRGQSVEEAVEIEFEDTGCGMSAENQIMMFTPFFSTKSHGLGVGLSISKSIMDVHRGQLWATPNHDRGMTFHIRLPVS